GIINPAPDQIHFVIDDVIQPDNFLAVIELVSAIHDQLVRGWVLGKREFGKNIFEISRCRGIKGSRADGGCGVQTISGTVIRCANRIGEYAVALILIGNRGIEGGKSYDPPDLFRIKEKSFVPGFVVDMRNE